MCALVRRIKEYLENWQVGSIWNLAFLVFSIQRLEFTIAANEIQGVNDVRALGQLLPLLISVGALMMMMGKAITANRRKGLCDPLRGNRSSPPPGHPGV